MALGDGTGWSEAAPVDTDPRKDGAIEIRDLRTGVRIRVEKEHILPAASSAGGEHKAGSAITYRQAVAPTTRPDGTTLTSQDDNRLWIDGDDDRLYYYRNGSGGSNNDFQKIVPHTVVPYVKGTVTMGALTGTFGSYVVVGKFFFSLILFLRSDAISSSTFTWADDTSPSNEETRIGGIRIAGGINTVESIEIDVEQPNAAGSQFRIRAGAGPAFYVSQVFSFVALVDNS